MAISITNRFVDVSALLIAGGNVNVGPADSFGVSSTSKRHRAKRTRDSTGRKPPKRICDSTERLCFMLQLNLHSIL
jgi:hypothetical protein